MSEAPPLPAPRFDSSRLVGALQRINRARALEREDDARPVALMAGFEALLEAETTARPARDAEGSDALRELRDLLAREGAGDAIVVLHDFLEPVLERLIEGLLERPETRLAAYGSLRPGESNHRLVADLVGRWREGTVRGVLHDRGWGAREGFPGLTWDPSGSPVRVHVLTSAALPSAWKRLDAFEGEAYRRILAPVETGEGILVCNLYELSPDA